MKTTVCLALATALILPAAAEAQDDEGSIDIGDVGSARIGGPGLTRGEKAWVKSWDEPEEYLTEESLPPVGHKKRLVGLHTLANRYVGGQMWKDACEKYDSIIEESGAEGVGEHPEGKKRAGKAFLQCAKIAYGISEYGKTEKLLKKSETFIKSDNRHRAVRRKMLRETYRKKMTDGDTNGAIKLFNQYQAQEKNEDERIWLGERLAQRAKASHESKDEISRDEMMGHLDTIAPMNTDYRRLKNEIESGQAILGNALMFAGAVIAFILGLGWFTSWRAKAKVGAIGSKNKFDLDDDL